MEELGIIEDGSMAVQNGIIIDVGQTPELLDKYRAEVQLDASGKVVTPGLIDAHTHIIFAGSRENELEMKIKGTSYLEILKQGGGILRTVRETRRATRDELLAISRKRCNNMLLHGTTTIEAKSGYGLTLEDEIKLLQVIRALDEQSNLTLVPTFLGAHALPPEFEGKTADFVSTVTNEWIPKVTELKLAKFCDVFCEKGIFEVEDARKILEAGRAHGLLSKIHADEFTALGGAELAAEVGAVSADHVLYSRIEGFRAMRDKGVIAVLLPAAPLTLMLDKYADARALINMGVAVALGSDMSPSCWLENQQLLIALACYRLKITPAEAITASTINAAHACRMASKIGSLETGKKADIAVFDIPDYRFLGYVLDGNATDLVIKNGKIVVRNRSLCN